MEDREFILAHAGAIVAWLKYDASALNLLLAEEYELEQERGLLARVRESVEVERILVETYKGGSIDGSNAEKRKMQTVLFLDRLEDEDEVYNHAVTELAEAEQALAETRMQLKQAANTFGATKHQARLIAAVLKATMDDTLTAGASRKKREIRK